MNKIKTIVILMATVLCLCACKDPVDEPEVPNKNNTENNVSRIHF